ncbi:DNA integrity scanning protein DisA [Thermosipho affectus]|uniref:DNA integrity scanning protein DisA n=1 Tax=Thermosipho affectus TaxID=660294 RepID=A0ABX3IJF3_9BACT|nr:MULTISPECIES: DNA integrity scanning diadenylate cyclase DisA [Thermosipho]ANQ53081.1 DNA integrity scanning protein DisA [Thermosipho sp. 1070]APT71530.1 DNA integrity scanning protein DisA [Thermosipho sp. 1063]ONN27950.1 DNA integrity scanning protein DisA [Thermosipho affectus]
MSIPQELVSKIKLLAPGTKLRKALDDIVLANFGALIVFIPEEKFKENEEIFQAGFKLDIPFMPEKLYELAKMDGAILVDDNVTKILAANVHLVPDASIPTSETGTRHRTAERVAKQIGELVIAVSKRRNIISLYYKNYRYIINDINFLITRVNQALNTLEKYRQNFDKMILNLDILEIENRVNLIDVVEIINKGIEILKIREEIDPYVIELGVEGRLASMQLEEIMVDIEDIIKNLILDYYKEDIEDEDVVEQIISTLKNYKERRPISTSRLLGYDDIANINQLSDYHVQSRGYRLLRNVAKIPMNITHNVVKAFGNVFSLSNADFSALKEVEGIGEKRATAIIDSINSMRNKISK